MSAPEKPLAWFRASKRPCLYVTTRGTLALVRGPVAQVAIDAVNADAKWSPRGRGFVVALGAVADVEAWAQAQRLLCVTSADKAVSS